MQIAKYFLSTPIVLAMTVALSGCSSSAPASFTLSATPAAVALTAGTSASVSLTAVTANGYSQAVPVTVTGLPAGVIATPSAFSLTPGTAQKITLSAASSATANTATLTFTGANGSTTGSTTVALNVAAAPDFTLAVAPTSQMITTGASGSQIALTVTAVNNFTGSVAVGVTGLPAGVTASPATLMLAPGTPQSLSLIAGSTAVAGSASLTFTGTSGSLTHTTTLALTVSAPMSSTPSTSSPNDVLTYHNDNTRQGLYSNETKLTLSNVNMASFGLLGNYPVDGVVDAQPLYLSGLSLQTGTSTHVDNVIFVATEHDSVYALNASTGDQLWKSSILGAGETTSDPRNCSQITPEIGITSTPVIDRSYGANGAIFIVGMTKDAKGGYHHRLHALDLTTGAELAGSPTEIAATYPGNGINSSNGTNVFNPAQYAERVGLTLLNGTIYTAWTSHCDISPYNGWVLGYNEKTLKQSSVLDLTPNGSDGSIWMSGYGLAADAAGYLYLLDANGTLDSSFTSAGFPSQNDFGNAILKLSTSASSLAVADFWEPYNTVAESNADTDLGSGGAMVLPDLKDSTGTVHHLVVGAGKDGNIYIANRDNLGKFNAADNSNLYQEIANALPNGAWSGPAYFNNTVFYAGVNDVLRAYTITNAKLSSSPTSQSATSFAYPGATPAVSANGAQNGIVWALESATNAPAVLHAYDASSLSHELYNSKQAPGSRDSFGMGNKFITPVVTDGQVLVGTPNSVAVFGLLQ